MIRGNGAASPPVLTEKRCWQEWQVRSTTIGSHYPCGYSIMEKTARPRDAAWPHVFTNRAKSGEDRCWAKPVREEGGSSLSWPASNQCARSLWRSYRPPLSGRGRQRRQPGLGSTWRAQGKAKRRQVPRLSANPVGVRCTIRVPALPPICFWCVVNVHPRSRFVNRSNEIFADPGCVFSGRPGFSVLTRCCRLAAHRWRLEHR